MPPVPNPYLNRIAVPIPPARVDTSQLEARIARLRAAFTLVLCALALSILGAALWPPQQPAPTRPLRVAEEVPAQGLASTMWVDTDSQ